LIARRVRSASSTPSLIQKLRYRFSVQGVDHVPGGIIEVLEASILVQTQRQQTAP
jgi:hypothetical protein